MTQVVTLKFTCPECSGVIELKFDAPDGIRKHSQGDWKASIIEPCMRCVMTSDGVRQAARVFLGRTGELIA